MSISVESLTKIYGAQHAVDGISFEVKPGEILGFLGPNGAGKSTTMKILTGYIPPTSGKASICGFDVTTHPLEVKKRVGYLPELNPLYTDMFVREYLRFMAGVHDLGPMVEKRTEEMIELVGLGPERTKKIGQLSKGYKQRVGLAQAMLHNPEVLILDEPTSGLDPNQIVEIRNLIKSFGSQKTIILSTHIMQEVQAMCSRVVIINKGKIVADQPVSELGKNAGQNYIFNVSFSGAFESQQLRQIEGLLEISGNQEGGYRIEASRDISEALFQFAVARKISLVSLNREEQNLEEIFRKLTTGQADPIGS